MKKLCFIGIILALTPSLSFGDDFRVNKLIQEKQRKMAELEKCMGSTKGLKIAGISTLGLTAVGVVGNVAEAKKINEYDDKIESTERSISKTQKQIDETRADLAKQKAEAEEKKRQEELKKNCKQSKGTWEDDGYCVCEPRNYNSTTGKCEDVTIATVQLANGNTVTGVLNPTTGVLMDTNGNVINTTGGTIVGTATVAAGTMGGTSVETDVDGTDVNGGSGDGSGNGDGGDDENNTPGVVAAAQCGIKCEGDYDGKTIACASENKSEKIGLYECKDNLWTAIKSIDDCTDFKKPSGYKKVGKWRKGYMFANSMSEISGASQKVWKVSKYCEACEDGKKLIDGKCQQGEEKHGAYCTKSDANKVMLWIGNESGAELWKCNDDGTWTEIKTIDWCNDNYLASYTQKGAWGSNTNKNFYYLASSAKYINSSDKTTAWVEYYCGACKSGYHKESGKCVQDKKTLMELVGNNISKGPEYYVGITKPIHGNNQCYLNGKKSNMDSCSGLNLHQWQGNFSWGKVRGKATCSSNTCYCSVEHLDQGGTRIRFSKARMIMKHVYKSNDVNSMNYCKQDCAKDCAECVYESDCRTQVFRAAGIQD